MNSDGWEWGGYFRLGDLGRVLYENDIWYERWIKYKGYHQRPGEELSRWKEHQGQKPYLKWEEPRNAQETEKSSRWLEGRDGKSDTNEVRVVGTNSTKK